MTVEKATSTLFGSSISSKLSVTAASSLAGSFATPTSSLFGGTNDIVVRVRRFSMFMTID